MNITMIGAGYVGLVSAACFSEFGWTVTCIDKDPSKIEHLRQGSCRSTSRASTSSCIATCAWGASHFRRISHPRSAMPTSCSSRSARRCGGATATPI